MHARLSDIGSQLKVFVIDDPFRKVLKLLSSLQSMELLAQYYTQSGQFIQAAKIYNQLSDFDWYTRSTFWLALVRFHARL